MREGKTKSIGYQGIYLFIPPKKNIQIQDVETTSKQRDILQCSHLYSTVLDHSFTRQKSNHCPSHIQMPPFGVCSTWRVFSFSSWSLLTYGKLISHCPREKPFRVSFLGVSPFSCRLVAIRQELKRYHSRHCPRRIRRRPVGVCSIWSVSLVLLVSELKYNTRLG